MSYIIPEKESCNYLSPSGSISTKTKNTQKIPGQNLRNFLIFCIITLIFLTAAHRRGIDLIKLSIIFGSMRFHSSSRHENNFFLLENRFDPMYLFNIENKCPIGFKSGDWAGQSNHSNPFWLYPVLHQLRCVFSDRIHVENPSKWHVPHAVCQHFTL